VKLRARLLLPTAVTCALLLVAIASSLWMLDQFKRSHRAGQQRIATAQAMTADSLKQLNAIQKALYRTMTLIASMDEAAVGSFRAAHAKQVAALADTVGQFGPALTGDADATKRLADFGALLPKYLAASDNAVDMGSGDPNMGVAALQTSDAVYRKLESALDGWGQRLGLMAAEEVTRTAAQVDRNGLAVACIGFAAAGAALAYAWFSIVRVHREVRVAVQAAEQVALGRLNIHIDSQANDEIGDLVRAQKAMADQLRQSIQSVQSATQCIGSASAEIASGNLDLSQRTEQTATDLQRAVQSVTRLTSTVLQGAESAREAERLAHSAAGVAQSGGRVMGDLVDTMDQISTGARRIEDIVGLIEDIAFRTNILALNAAVEAARAGEQGRGFAVVATEVRSLAARSAAAAREIKQLIAESAQRVEAGSQLVGDAGVTMTDIVSSALRVSEVIRKISGAASEQESGITGISDAVQSLDRMTQQNAAMVEESAAAAQSLKDQVGKLSRVLDSFAA